MASPGCKISIFNVSGTFSVTKEVEDRTVPIILLNKGSGNSDFARQKKGSVWLIKSNR